VVLHTGQPHSLLAVPVAAVQSDSTGEYVTLLKTDGSTQRVTVTSGDLANGQVTLTTSSGLKAGDQVAIGTTSSTTTKSSSNSSNGGGIPLPGGPGGL
jgi:membrane fusion protein, macrolide-specific efflux system